MYSLETCAIGISMSKILHMWSIKPFSAFHPGQNRVNFFHSISYLEVIFVSKHTQSYMDGCFSFCFNSCRWVIFSGTELKFLLEAKLSPVFNHGVFWSEENVIPNTWWCISVGVSYNFLELCCISLYFMADVIVICS